MNSHCAAIDRAIRRITAMAGFRDAKSLEDFDFSFNPSIKKSQVFDLATCKFVRERRDVLWVGPPGTGRAICVRHLVYAPFAVV